jgi:hypothetical protein
MSFIMNKLNSVMGNYGIPGYVQQAHVVKDTVIRTCNETCTWLDRKVEALVADQLPVVLAPVVMTILRALPEIVMVHTENPVCAATWSVYTVISSTPIFRAIISGNWPEDGWLVMDTDVIKARFQKLLHAVAVCYLAYAVGAVVSLVIGCGSIALSPMLATKFILIAMACSQYDLQQLQGTETQELATS